MKTRPLIFTVPALIFIALAGRAFAADALAVVPDEIFNANSDNKSFLPASLQVKMKFAERDRSLNSGIQSVRVAPTRATDDTGLSLLNPERYGADWKHVYVFPTLEAELDSPARGAKTLRELSGTVEIYRPQDDPASVVTIAGVSQLSPQTLDDPMLKAAGIEINIVTYAELDRYRKSLRDPKIAYPPASEQILKRENGSSLPYYLENTKSGNKANFAMFVKDPDNRLVEKEIQFPDDKKVNVSNSSTGGRTTFIFSDSPPPNFGLRLYVATPKSLTTIQFKFTDLALPARTPEPPVAATNIHDDRRTGPTFIPSSLDIDLKIAADEVAKARSVRATVASAVDAAGKPLLNAELFKDDWDKIRAGENKVTTSASIKLDSPTRTAKTLREVTGTIELYDPARDPQSVITVADITAQAGQTLAGSTLKALGLEITFLNKEQLERARKVEADKPAPTGTPEIAPKVKAQLIEVIKALFGDISVDEKSVAFRVTDPRGRLVDVGLETAGGEAIERISRTRSGSLQVYGFKDAIPKDARLKIHVATPKSVTEIPFKLTDVPLP